MSFSTPPSASASTFERARQIAQANPIQFFDPRNPSTSSTTPSKNGMTLTPSTPVTSTVATNSQAFLSPSSNNSSSSLSAFATSVTLLSPDTSSVQSQYDTQSLTDTTDSSSSSTMYQSLTSFPQPSFSPMESEYSTQNTQIYPTINNNSNEQSSMMSTQVDTSSSSTSSSSSQARHTSVPSAEEASEIAASLEPRTAVDHPSIDAKNGYHRYEESVAMIISQYIDGYERNGPGFEQYNLNISRLFKNHSLPVLQAYINITDKILLKAMENYATHKNNIRAANQNNQSDVQPQRTEVQPQQNLAQKRCSTMTLSVTVALVTVAAALILKALADSRT